MLDPSWVVTSIRMSSAVCAKQKQTGVGFASALAPTWQITSWSSTMSSPRKNTTSHARFGQYRHVPATAVGRCARTGAAPTTTPGSPLNGHNVPASSTFAQQSLTRRRSLCSARRPSSLRPDRWLTGSDGVLCGEATRPQAPEQTGQLPPTHRNPNRLPPPEHHRQTATEAHNTTRDHQRRRSRCPTSTPIGDSYWRSSPQVVQGSPCHRKPFTTGEGQGVTCGSCESESSPPSQVTRRGQSASTRHGGCCPTQPEPRTDTAPTTKPTATASSSSATPKPPD